MGKDKEPKNLKLSIKNIDYASDINAKDINRQLKRLHNKLPRLYRPVREQVIFAEFHERISKKVSSDIGERFNSLVDKLGFPPALIMPSLEIRRLLEIYEVKGYNYTNRLFERYMTLFIFNNDTIVALHNRWRKSQWLNNRMNILNKVVEGHLDGYYELSIPTILAQLEGIIIEGMLKIEWQGRGKKIYYSHILEFAKFLLSDIDKYSFDNLITNLFENNILANFTKGEEVTINLSRHAILHGADTKYGTKLNSIKAIILFDYFFHKLDGLYSNLELKEV